MSAKDNYFKTAFDRYLLALCKTPAEEKTKHTDRGALQTLLQAIVDESAKGVNVQHEPKRVADKRAPDFKIRQARPHSPQNIVRTAYLCGLADRNEATSIPAMLAPRTRLNINVLIGRRSLAILQVGVCSLASGLPVAGVPALTGVLD